MEKSIRYFELPPEYSIDHNRFLTYIDGIEWTSFKKESGIDWLEPYHGYPLQILGDDTNAALGIDLAQGTYEGRGFRDEDITNIREDIHPELQAFLKRFIVPISKSRFSKLESRSTFPPHIDPLTQNITRLHWPIKTNEKVFFNYYEDGKRVESIVPEEGRAYAFNTQLTHSLQNKSDQDRIHLIVNINMSYDYFHRYITAGGLLWH